MLNSKGNPVGVDVPIERMNSFLYDELKALWGLSDQELDGFGRCYRDKEENGYVPKFFVPGVSSDNTIYKAIDFDDTNNTVLYFFDEGDSVKVKGSSCSTNVDLIFMVNIAKIKKTIAHRGDEEIRIDVEKICRFSPFALMMTEMVTGFKSVFNRFDGLLSPDQVAFRDLHPLHVFKFSFNLIYNIR